MIRSRCKCGKKMMFPEGAAIRMVCAHCDSVEFEFTKRVVIECRNKHRQQLSANHFHNMRCEECKKNPKLSLDNMSRHIWELGKDEDFVDETSSEEEKKDNEEPDEVLIRKGKKS
ncbi:MAG: hypothetical protein ACXADW_22070 [Candidatus Hodarchaeales archaeon]|jgi:hypothetical protein